MKNQKMTIITVVSICIAVFAVLLLVLFMTGVIQLGSQGVSNVSAYDYLLANGMFTATNEISGIGTEYTHYEWASTDGIYKLTRNDFYHDWGTESYYSFYSKNCYGVASISDTSVNNSPSSEEAYEEFFEWCETNGYSSGQMMAALDKYAESRE